MAHGDSNTMVDACADPLANLPSNNRGNSQTAPFSDHLAGDTHYPVAYSLPDGVAHTQCDALADAHWHPCASAASNSHAAQQRNPMVDDDQLSDLDSAGVANNRFSACSATMIHCCL